MDDKIFDQIQQVDLKKTMETSYIDYAMSVIASRALPDFREEFSALSTTKFQVVIDGNLAKGILKILNEIDDEYVMEGGAA